MNYPIDIEATKGQWLIHDLETGESVEAGGNGDWPDGNGDPLNGLPPNLIPVLKVIEPVPDYDSATQKLNRHDGLVNTTLNEKRTTWKVIDLTPEEIESRFKAQVPPQLANWRVKAVLDLQSLTPQVEAFIAAMEEGPDKVIVSRAWNGNGDVLRESSTVKAIQAVLGLTEKQVDEMFILGATFNP